MLFDLSWEDVDDQVKGGWDRGGGTVCDTMSTAVLSSASIFPRAKIRKLPDDPP